MSAAAAGNGDLARAGALLRAGWRSRWSCVAETGRQPVDNPDTHLELTMIHEGPLLEYAGRDLAYLQWAAAARHWIMLVLAAELFLPHGGPLALRLGTLADRAGRCSASRLAAGRDGAGEDADPACPRAARAGRG